MKEIRIGKNQCGQRLDKFLQKYLSKAPKSFLYKMLRKKNIKRNGRRAEGSEILCEGDVLTLFYPMRRWKSSQAAWAGQAP